MIRRVFSATRTPFAWAIGMIAATPRNVWTALVQIYANKGRSVLTTLGIIIAVTSTITVISIVQGFGNYMTDMVRGYGTTFMVVRPWNPGGWQDPFQRRVRMDVHDLTAVREECTALKRLTPFLYTRDAEIQFGQSVVKDVPVRGVTEEYQIIRNFHADAGRFYGPVEVDQGAKVIVLGRSVIRDLGASESIVGEHIFLDGMRFLVVGILAEKGERFGDDQDNTVMIPWTAAVQLNGSLRDNMMFLVEATSEETIPQLYDQITRVLRSRHGLGPGEANDFRIDRQDQAVRQFEGIRNAASGILAGIVSISLLVGGVGIMNMMLVSVTERTREIGLRKSIGGRRRDILLQFLTEAVVLCTVGGIAGVVLGYAITFVASQHPSMVDVSVPLWSVALALGFSAMTGVVFGLIPAMKAALLHPIDALRHE